jgi:hypothetical protein
MKDKKQKKDKKPAQTQQKATQFFQKISTQEYKEHTGDCTYQDDD